MNRRFLVVFSACAALASGCAAQIEEQKIRHGMDEIWRQKHLDQIDVYYAPNVAPEVRQFVDENQAVWPDAKFTVDHVIVHGNVFAVEWTVTGTHRDYGKPVTLSGVNIDTVDGLKVVDEKRYFDNLAVYAQLGFQLVPPTMVGLLETWEKQQADAATQPSK